MESQLSSLESCSSRTAVSDPIFLTMGTGMVRDPWINLCLQSTLSHVTMLIDTSRIQFAINVFWTWSWEQPNFSNGEVWLRSKSQVSFQNLLKGKRKLKAKCSKTHVSDQNCRVNTETLVSLFLRTCFACTYVHGCTWTNVRVRGGQRSTQMSSPVALHHIFWNKVSP